jgi:hypothetical protein
MDPEITEKLEEWGIIREIKCTNCNMLLHEDLKGFNRIRKFQIIKEMMEELNYKNKYVPNKFRRYIPSL